MQFELKLIAKPVLFVGRAPGEEIRIDGSWRHTFRDSRAEAAGNGRVSPQGTIVSTHLFCENDFGLDIFEACFSIHICTLLKLPISFIDMLTFVLSWRNDNDLFL